MFSKYYIISWVFQCTLLKIQIFLNFHIHITIISPYTVFFFLRLLGFSCYFFRSVLHS